MIKLKVRAALPKMIDKATRYFVVNKRPGRQCPREVSTRDHEEVETVIQRLQLLVGVELLVGEHHTETVLPAGGIVMIDRVMRMFVDVFKGIGDKEGVATTVDVEGSRKQAVSYCVMFGSSSLNRALGWVK